VSDQYENWRARLEAQARGVRLASTTEPDPGFYKRRMIKNGPFVPVWIYPRVDGKPWLARRTEGPGRVFEIDAYKEWERCYGRAITKEEYLQVVGGGEWFGVDSIVGEQSREDAEAVRSGSNQPADEAEVLKDQISHALAGVGKYAKLKGWTKRKKVEVPLVDSLIKSDDDLAHAQSMRARLNELAREADEKFHKEKDPITKQGKAIDERWSFKKDAENAALLIREAMAAYETAKLEAGPGRGTGARRGGDFVHPGAGGSAASDAAGAPSARADDGKRRAWSRRYDRFAVGRHGDRRPGQALCVSARAS
jgi:hypothetical protein